MRLATRDQRQARYATSSEPRNVAPARTWTTDSAPKACSSATSKGSNPFAAVAKKSIPNSASFLHRAALARLDSAHHHRAMQLQRESAKFHGTILVGDESSRGYPDWHCTLPALLPSGRQHD